MMWLHPERDWPRVTVIMPVRNEGRFIERSLSAVFAQEYPHGRMDVLVVDGMSTDGTREIVRELLEGPDVPSSLLGHIKVLENPGRIVPTAMNIGLQNALGKVIVRVDGHCEIDKTYLKHCVEVLNRSEADCVGGCLETRGETVSARAISLAQGSWFGVGGASFRIGKGKPGLVDTVAFGAYRREVFDRIGGFDEELVRNQDDELNFRLTQAGGKIWLEPSIRSIYHSRADLRSLWKQYFQYGMYKVRLIQKRRAVPSWRHLVPAVFVLGLASSVILAGLTGCLLWAAVIAGPYAVANILASLWAGRRDWRTLPILPVAFLILHFAYGLGFLWGIWRWRKYFGRDQEVVECK